MFYKIFNIICKESIENKTKGTKPINPEDEIAYKSPLEAV